MPFPPRFRDGARNAAPSSCRSSLRCRERRAVVRAEPDWLLDALAHRGPPASGFAARVRAWSAMLRGRHGTTTRRAGPARSNDGTCVRPCWPCAHRGRQPCVLIWRTAAAGARQKSRALRASGGMADAHGSGPCVRKDVGVQLPPCPRSRPEYVRSAGDSADDGVLHRPEHRGSPRRYADLGVHVLDVVVGCLRRDAELVGDLSRRESSRG
jgi:hypothetical protein